MKNTDTKFFFSNLPEAIQLEHSGTTKRNFTSQNESEEEKSDNGHQENEDEEYALFI